MTVFRRSTNGRASVIAMLACPVERRPIFSPYAQAVRHRTSTVAPRGAPLMAGKPTRRPTRLPRRAARVLNVGENFAMTASEAPFGGGFSSGCSFGVSFSCGSSFCSGFGFTVAALYINAFPWSSTAAQNVEDEHDTDVRPPIVSRVGIMPPAHSPNSYVLATPFPWSTAAQNNADAHETELNPSTSGADGNQDPSS
jgi:hypothetical protein